MGCMLSHLASKFAFFPPSPPTYQIKKREDGKLMVVSTSPAPVMPVPHCDENSLDVLLIDTKNGNKIVAFYLRNPCARLTLLYSHGNAADLGQLYDLFVQLKLNLRVNLMGYDYSGYGASTGKPSEYNTYADIEAVYECLETEYGVSQEDIILYGQSVGSGPTLHLAAKLPRLRGVVLHSAILSGLRVLCHVQFTLCFDIYKNIDKIQKVKCPVLVIHGTEDDVVNWLHGNGLWEMAREPYEPLWIKGGGHCNLELYPDYIRHLCRFVQEMENLTTKTRLKKIKPSLLAYNSSFSAKKWWKIKLRRPNCPKCSTPKCSMLSFSCLKCPKCSTPKCSMPSFSCLKCLKCSTPKCSMPSFSCLKCPKCSTPKCSMPSFSCLKCLKCSTPKCSMPSFSCLKCPKCCRIALPTCSFRCFGWTKCSLPTCSVGCFECWTKPTWPSCLKCRKPACCCNGCFGCAKA